jgi:uncharacterized membrane protein
MGTGVSAIATGVTVGVSKSKEEELKECLAGLSDEERERIRKILIDLKQAKPEEAEEAKAEEAKADEAKEEKKTDGEAVAEEPKDEQKADDPTFGLSEVMIASVKTAFKKIDTDDSGFIEANELKNVMKELDIEVTDEEAAIVMKNLDINGDGKLQFEEYLRMVGATLKVK